MRRTSSHGTSEGFAIVDAMIALFIAGVALVAVCGTLSFTIRYASTHLNAARQEISKRNAIAENFMGSNAPK